jgi:anti-anti-sigma factor
MPRPYAPLALPRLPRDTAEVPEAGHGRPDGDVLEVEVDRDDGSSTAVVRVHGDVDAASVGELRAALDQAIADGATDLRVDLTAVPFLDSTGLTALIEASTKLEGRGTVVVTAASAPVRRTIEMTGLGTYFEAS